MVAFLRSGKHSRSISFFLTGFTGSIRETDPKVCHTRMSSKILGESKSEVKQVHVQCFSLLYIFVVPYFQVKNQVICLQLMCNTLLFATKASDLPISNRFHLQNVKRNDNKIKQGMYQACAFLCFCYTCNGSTTKQWLPAFHLIKQKWCFCTYSVGQTGTSWIPNLSPQKIPKHFGFQLQ